MYAFSNRAAAKPKGSNCKTEITNCTILCYSTYYTSYEGYRIAFLALTMALVQVVPVQTILARKVLFGFLNWLLWNCDKLHQYTLYWSIGISLGA